MKDSKKMKLYLLRDFELMFILYIIFSIPNLLTGVDALFICIRLAVIILLGFGISFAKKGEKGASIFGIIVSVLMMISGSLVTLLFGAFMLAHSIIYLINYDKIK